MNDFGSDKKLARQRHVGLLEIAANRRTIDDQMSLPDPVNRSRSEMKRTPEMLVTICKLVQKGLSVRHASEKVRVHYTTIGRWRQEDDEFDAALRAAEAAFIEEQTANIRGAGKRNWQASAWLLERKWPQFFSQPQVQLNMTGPAKIEFEDLSVTIERVKKDPQLLKDIEEIQALGIQKWMALQEARRTEKLVPGREIKQIEDAKPIEPTSTQP
ncbi:MAG: hypothetical protein ACR2NX_04250 [Chthoniobacterales bacterium]